MMKYDNSDQNPWAGLSSYEDPAKSEHKLKFCGRDNETKEVARLIDDNFFVTLYGKSGIGKTSLLNAGVFPALRREQYTPLSMRLGMTEETSSFQDVITMAVECAIDEIGGSVRIVNVMDEQAEKDATDYLWRWFACRRFITAKGQITFPVLVFDQFEEVFRYKESRRKTKVLLEQLNYLIDENHAISDCVVDGEKYNYDFNFRFVLSIREDDLYRLEDTLDNCSLPALKHCRYRLRSLSEQGARDAILIPGDGLFFEKDKDAIVEILIGEDGAARNKDNDDQSISTNVLSLVCNRIYNNYITSKTAYISLQLVESFMKADPIDQFYKEATSGFTNREKAYLENNLIDSTGNYRNSVLKTELDKNVRNWKELIRGTRKILQYVSTTNAKNYRIELIHDSFCRALLNSRKRRQNKKKVIWIIGLVMLIIIISLGMKLKETSQALSESEIELLKEESEHSIYYIKYLLERHDQYNAMSYAVSVLPNDLAHPNRPYTPEAEHSLRASVRCDATILKGYEAYSVSFSPNADKVVFSTCDSKKVVVWDMLSKRNNIHEMSGHSALVLSTAFSHDGEKIISSSIDNTIKIWDAKTYKLIKTITGHTGPVRTAFFSSDDKYILSSSNDSTARIWDARNYKEIKKFVGHNAIILSAKYDKTNERIVTSSSDGTVRVWNAKTGKSLQALRDTLNKNEYYSDAVFSPDGTFVYAAAHGGTIKRWKWESGNIDKVYYGHSSGVHSLSLTSDGKTMVSVGEENIIIWDALTGNVHKELNLHKTTVCQVSISYDDQLIVSGSPDGKVIVWRDLKEIPLEKNIIQLNGGVTCSIYSPDGKYLISGLDDGTISVWDLTKDREKARMKIHTSNVTTLSYSPNARSFASASDDGLIIIWDAETGKPLLTLYGHTWSVNSLSFNLEGSIVASTSYDGSVRLWDVLTGSVICKLVLSDKIPNHALFSQTDNQLIVSYSNNEVRCWNLKDGTNRWLLSSDSRFCNGFDLHPNGSEIVLAASNPYGICWKIASSGHPLWGMTSENVLYDVKYSPNGEYVAFVDNKNVLTIRHAKTGIVVMTYDGDSSYPATSVSYSPDGRNIAVSSMDGKVRIYDFIPLQELIDIVRTIVE